MFSSSKKKESVSFEIDLEMVKLKDFKIHRAIIISVARLTYQEVEKVF